MSFFARSGRTGWANPGYVPIRLPRVGLGVLDVFVQQGGDFDQLGNVGDLFDPGDNDGGPEPFVARGETVANFGNRYEVTSKVNLGVSSFDQVLGPLGKRLAIKGKRQRGASFGYRYAKVSLDSVKLPKFDVWLRMADVDHASPLVADLAVADRLFVAVGAYYAKQLDLKLLDSTDAELELSEPTVGAEAGAGRVVSTGLDVEFKSPKPLCIAMKLMRLHNDGDGYRISGTPAGKKSQMIRSGPSAQYEVFDGPVIGIGAPK
jgi:hypothetical protein